MKLQNIIATVKGVPGYVRSHWKTPGEGEHLSLSEMTAYMFTQAGSYVFMTFSGILAFGSTYFTGSIMGIANIDFSIISVMSTIINYVLIFLNPISVLIYENHGRLSKRMKVFAITAYTLELVIGVGCYFIPSKPFETIIKGLPQLIGNILVVSGIRNFVTWGIRRAFSAKYGRLKPILLFSGIPSAILMSVIPFLPVQNLSYTSKLIVLHFSFTLMNYFYQNFINVNGLVTFMTPNSQERQRLFSFVPIVSGFFSSVIGIFLPMLITTTGGYLNLKTYRVFVPIFCFAGALMSLAVIKCKERVIEAPIEKRKKVTFFSGAKKVLQNKYFWIVNISNLLGQWQWLIGNLLSWWFIYSLRMEWFSGIAANIVVVGMTAGNIACPILTRRFEKRDILVASRFATVLLCFGIVIAVKTGNIVIFMASTLLRNTVQPVVDGVNQGINADIQHYHQARFGERADSMSGVFSWFLNPVIVLIGYIIPYVQKIIGFTSDWDVLYDSAILTRVFTVYSWATIISVFLLTIPYLFYDLTKEKYAKCIEKLENQQEDADPALEAQGATAQEVEA